MANLRSGRPGFRNWVDKKPNPEWPLMPLTHVTKGIIAEDIIRDGHIKPRDKSVGRSRRPLSYFFYGRPAYRVSGDGAVRVEAACPFCFVFDSSLIKDTAAIHAFDTGAFKKRLYKHVLLDEMQVEDFSLERDETRPNRIIASIFHSLQKYFEGDTSQISIINDEAEVWEFHARAYLDLLSSQGRNEPDDRIFSIEVAFDKLVVLAPYLKALIVPHTLWRAGKKAPWIYQLESMNVIIKPYVFTPGRHPEYYQTIVECAVRDLYREWGLL